MNRIVALSGKAQSGKTTAAVFMAARIDGIASVESFAKPIKQIVADQFSEYLTPEDLIHNKNKIIQFRTKSMTVRDLMIEVGKMYRRIDEDYWLNKLIARAHAKFDSGCPMVLVDDMRFPNEYQYMNDNGMITVRIENPRVTPIDDESEWALDGRPFDYTIFNDGSIEDYYARLDALLQSIKSGSAR